MRYRKTAVAVLFIAFSATPVMAGVGVHVGYDMTTIPELNAASFQFEQDAASGFGLSTLTRAESGQPLNIGVDLTFNMLPVVDLQISIEGAFSSYDIVFIPAAGSGQPNVSETIPYLRAGADATALVDVFKFPPLVGTLHFQVGGGVGLYAFGPVVTPDLLKENIKSANEEVKPEDYVKANLKFAYHLAGGVKIKPPAFPFAFRVLGKYYIISGQETDVPDSFLTVQAGILIGG